MDFIEFDTHLSKDGKIPVPEEFVDELAHKEILHVQVTTSPSSNLKKGVIREMIENPIIIPGFKPSTREENY
jgi:hypothetical protein